MLGHKKSGYIDDSLLMSDEYSECAKNVSDTVHLMTNVGFMIHEKKSVLIPTKKVTFLSSREKSRKIVQACTELYELSKESRNVAQVLGLMVSSFSAVEYGPLFYRNIEHAKIQVLKCHAGDYENFMCVS